MDCRLVVAQTNPALGDVRANLEDHLERIEAVAGKADLILFPELSLTGYFLRDQVAEVALEPGDAFFRPLLELSKRVSIAFGFVERSIEGRPYNALGFLEDGEFLAVHRKVHLVSYGLFDEGRDFAPGNEFRTIDSKHGRFGPLICEDVWHMPSAYSYFLDDVDAFLCASASPARGVEKTGEGLASQRTWNILLSAQALMFRTWLACASRVGWEDGIGFGGGSCVLDPYADRRGSLKGIEPGTFEVRMDAATLRRARTEVPLRRDEKLEILATSLTRHVPLLRALSEHAAR